MKTYNLITAEQIARLEAQSCRCEDWNSVSVQIKLGSFKKIFTFAGGIRKHSAIFPATLHNVVVGDDCMI